MEAGIGPHDAGVHSPPPSDPRGTQRMLYSHVWTASPSRFLPPAASRSRALALAVAAIALSGCAADGRAAGPLETAAGPGLETDDTTTGVATEASADADQATEAPTDPPAGVDDPALDGVDPLAEPAQSSGPGV